MLTYFEIRPDSIFDTHPHKSEQITMVLEGELFFKFENQRDICIKSGEVMPYRQVLNTAYIQKGNRSKP